MPIVERVTKDLRNLVGDSVSFLKNGLRLPVVVAWPDYPGSRTTLTKICRYNKFRLTNKLLPDPEVVIYFEDHTTGDVSPLLSRYSGRTVWNSRCADISKAHTDAIHATVFGYALTIDPLTYTGTAVAKSDANAKHDGRIITCPVPQVDPETVYQTVIDNTVDERFVVDYRVPVICGTIPLAYAKYKRHNVRFTNEVDHARLLRPEEFFSKNELNLLIRFADAMGADFCELDVLRNKGNGLIYVVDLNKTPYGPPAGLSPAESKQAIRQLAQTFLQAIRNNQLRSV